MRLLILLLALTLLLPRPTLAAAPADPRTYHRAFDALDAGHVDRAMELVARGYDPVLNRVIRGVYMAHPGNDVSFDELSAFITKNPAWPNMKGILAIAEQKIPANATPTQIVGWFSAHPPVTLTGFSRYVEALNAAGQTQNLTQLIRTRWIEGTFSPDDLADFYARYARYLDADTHKARLDHLLWKDDEAGARRMAPYVDANSRAVAEARMALADHAPNAEALVARIQEDGQNDSGLLYERLRCRVKDNSDTVALDILLHAPDNLGKPEAWWEQRQIEIRRMMDRHDYLLAYKLAANHGQTESKTLTQAEFLAGWLALRFLNRPDLAQAHFQALYDNAATPVSRARGAYWLGRTYEALDDKSNAEQSYETAAALNMTYYGQLATTRLYANPLITAAPEPTIPAQIRSDFFARDNIRAIDHLYALGERERARVFYHAAMEGATQRFEFALLTDLAYKIHRPDLAIEAAKAASQKNMLISVNGFPILKNDVPNVPEPAFTHALIRQESMFNAGAASPVGAQGLMQLMPGTAKYMAKKLEIKYRPALLTQPAYNIRLGTAYIKNQLDIFDGSYVLGLAGYNAGPGRVRQWMNQLGDPRNPNVDDIDWVESIPVAETRNYVQRIIESTQIYRARLNGGQAPLLILTDLKR